MQATARLMVSRMGPSAPVVTSAALASTSGSIRSGLQIGSDAKPIDAAAFSAAPAAQQPPSGATSHPNVGETPVDEFSTRFGSQKVEEGEKAAKVHEVFDSVASQYDLMNDFMSAGIHRLWKDELVYATLNPRPAGTYLDLAGGTGDIAFRIHAAMARNTPGAPTGRPNATLADVAAAGAPPVTSTIASMAPKILSTLLGAPAAPAAPAGAGVGAATAAPVALDAVANPLVSVDDAKNDAAAWKAVKAAVKSDKGGVVVCDITADMLAVGQRRIAGAADLTSAPWLSWVEGNAEELPFEDDSFDGITMAFGLRNTSHLDAVMRETLRVLKPGGRFLVLEFSTPPNPVFKSVYDAYSYAVIPSLGQAVAGDRDSYQYLVESIRAFPRQATLASLMAEQGYSNVTYTNLSGGICAIHSGFKPVL